MIQPSRIIQGKVTTLKPYQQDIIQEIINNFLNNNEINVLEILKKHNYCKKCGSIHLAKNGTSNGHIPQYKCRDCGFHQSLTSQTLLHGVRDLDKWVDFIYHMLSNKKVVSCVEMGLKLGTAPKTIHAWRHKFLAALNVTNPLKIKDEVELDEVYIPFCVKGEIGNEKYVNYRKELRPLNLNIKSKLRRKELKMMKHNYRNDSKKHSSIFLCLHNRQGDFDFLPLRIQQKGAVTAKILEEALKNYDLSGKTAITDAGIPMKKLMKNRPEINHISFNSSDIKKGKMVNKKAHNNNINNVMKRFEQWSDGFNGYSTKYQWNYLKWFRYISIFENNTKDMVIKALDDVESNKRFRNIFGYYKDFVAA